MPFPTTNKEAINTHLIELGVERGDNLVVHSRLLSFGRIDGGPAMIVGALLDRVGPEGTVVMPTYTLARGTLYDQGVTPSQGLGPLPEILRKLPGAVRSRCPMHNHAGFGPKASILLRPSGRVSLGPGSDFSELQAEGFKLVLLGCKPSEGATFLHHLEAVHSVPYRAMISLQRSIVDSDGSHSQITVDYFAVFDPSYHESFDNVVDPKKGNVCLQSVSAPLGTSFVVELNDLANEVTKRLKADPYSIVEAK